MGIGKNHPLYSDHSLLLLQLKMKTDTVLLYPAVFTLCAIYNIQVKDITPTCHENNFKNGTTGLEIKSPPPKNDL